MGEIGLWGNCCLGLSTLGFIFYFYLTLICLLSPDRFHILKYKDKHEDNEKYTTAWSSAATGCFLYFLIAASLAAYKFSTQENRDNFKEWLRINQAEERVQNDYELTEIQQFNKNKQNIIEPEQQLNFHI